METTINTSKGLNTSADGIETEQQRDALKSLGCDDIQGFVMSRPVGRADVMPLRAARCLKEDHDLRWQY